MNRTKFYILLSAAVCLLYQCTPTSQAADLKPSIQPSASVIDVKIVGPDTVQPGGRPIKLDVEGATIQQILDGDGKVILYPRGGAEVWEAASWTGQPYMLFFADQAGRYIVIMAFAHDGKLAYAEKEITCGDPGPDPDPDPDPEPDPDPDPNQKWQVVFFHESDDLDNYTPGQREMLASLAFRQELNAKGHLFQGAYDYDATSNTTKGCDAKGRCRLFRGMPADLKPWWDAVRGDPLPRFAVQAMSGGGIQDFSLPATVEEFYKLLEGN